MWMIVDDGVPVKGVWSCVWCMCCEWLGDGVPVNGVYVVDDGICGVPVLQVIASECVFLIP